MSGHIFGCHDLRGAVLPVGGGQSCCPTPDHAEDSPHHRVTSPECQRCHS